MASAGLQQLAELGSTRKLESELKSQVNIIKPKTLYHFFKFAFVYHGKLTVARNKESHSYFTVKINSLFRIIRIPILVLRKFLFVLILTINIDLRMVYFFTE